MATLQEIQACQLNILKTVADICDKHNIAYYLACGTFLGAVRHQGFIPWDDDVDLYMEYNDLRRFKEICKTELPHTLFYQDCDSDPSSFWMFTKIRANNTYMPENADVEQARKITYHQGVWIDIFPLLEAADSPEKIRMQIDAIHNYQQAIIQRAGSLYRTGMSLPGKIIATFHHLRWNHIVRKHKKCFEKLQSNTSEQVLIMSNAYWKQDKEKVHAEAMRKTISKKLLLQEKYAFEDTAFYGIKDYHTYLLAEYGADYMTPKKWAHLEDYTNVVINV